MHTKIPTELDENIAWLQHTNGVTEGELKISPTPNCICSLSISQPLKGGHPVSSGEPSVSQERDGLHITEVGASIPPGHFHFINLILNQFIAVSE